MPEKIVVILYQLTIMSGALIVLKLVTNFLDSAAFGTYALILSIISFISILPFNSIAQANIRYFSIYKSKKRLPELVYVIRKWLIIFIAFYFTIFTIFGLSTNSNYHLIIVIYALTISEVVKTLLRGLINADRKRVKLLLSGLLEFLAKIALMFTVSTFFQISLNKIIIIFIISNLISLFPLIVHIFRLSRRPQKKLLSLIERQVFTFSAPMIIWGAFGWMRDMSNRWYLNYFIDSDSVAIFTVLSSITLILPTIIQGLVNSYYVPIIYQRQNIDPLSPGRFMNKLIIYYLVLSILIVITVIIFDREIIKLLSSEYYTEYSNYLVWMVLAYLLYVLSTIMALEIFAAKKITYLIIPNIAPGVVCLIAGYFLIRSHGLNGAFYCYILTYVSYAIIMFISIYRFRKNEVHK